MRCGLRGCLSWLLIDLATVADMLSLWVGGEWGGVEVASEVVFLVGGVVGACVRLLSSVVLRAENDDWWVWELHSSQRYTVSSAYQYLTSVEGNILGDNYRCWSKAVPLKINIFA